jgi:hypothetical protein
MTTLTDALTVAVSNWLTGVLARPFDEERRQAIELCLTAPGTDLQVVIRLREGALVDEGTAEGYAPVQPRHALNNGRHLREDSTGLEPIIGRAIDLTATLSLGAGQVAEPEHGRKRCLAIAATNTEHGGPHQALSGLVRLVNGSNKFLLPRTELKQRARLRSRRAGQALNKTNNALRPTEARFLPWMRPGRRR